MKFGVHAGLWQRAWSDDIAPILERAADLGFDGVELSLLGLGPEKAADLRRRAETLGLELTCSTGLSPEADPGSADPQTRAHARQTLTDAIGAASELGAGVLCGVVASPWGMFEPGRKSERAKLVADTLSQLDETLAAADVVLCIEALNRFETDLTNTADETCAIARATGTNRIGVLLDTFHMNIEEKSPPDAIRQAGERLRHFHISDNDRGVPGSGRHDFASDAAALGSIGYKGWVVAEMFVMAGNENSGDVNIWRDIEPDPTGAAREALDFMRRTFS